MELGGTVPSYHTAAFPRGTYSGAALQHPPRCLLNPPVAAKPQWQWSMEEHAIPPRD
jgi:hypothetical protein